MQQSDQASDPFVAIKQGLFVGSQSSFACLFSQLIHAIDFGCVKAQR